MRYIGAVTRDGARVPLPFCNVDLFYAGSDLYSQTVISDANGLYSFCVPNDPAMLYYLRAYLAGSPDVMGTTDNLTGTGP